MKKRINTLLLVFLSLNLFGQTITDIVVNSMDHQTLETATTLQGEDITVTIKGSDVFINDAQVTVADINADNGVVHVIDAVLLPPSTKGISSISERSIMFTPNPASDYNNIKLPVEVEGEKQLQLMNASGQLLCTQMTSGNTNRIDLNGLSSGIYFLRIDTINGSYFDKVMKTNCFQI